MSKFLIVIAFNSLDLNVYVDDKQLSVNVVKYCTSIGLYCITLYIFFSKFSQFKKFVFWHKNSQCIISYSVQNTSTKIDK